MTKEEVYQFLAGHPLAVLSTVGEDGNPYSACIYFVTDYNLDFYFLTKSDTKKAANMLRNNHVSLVIANEKGMSMIQVTGSAEIIEETEMNFYIKKRLSELFISEKPVSAPITKLTTHDGVIVYKVTPNWMRFGDFSKPEIGSVFSQIIPQTPQNP